MKIFLIAQGKHFAFYHHPYQWNVLPQFQILLCKDGVTAITLAFCTLELNINI